ncbi:MAG: hypothetical protein M3299_01930 [Thermoproteota archaeon]|nr:hypothetical protein [Thermoproteota archaeon]
MQTFDPIVILRTNGTITSIDTDTDAASSSTTTITETRIFFFYYYDLAGYTDRVR